MFDLSFNWHDFSIVELSACGIKILGGGGEYLSFVYAVLSYMHEKSRS